MTELVYLTLSHFNRETRTYFLNKAGYTSLLDYELSTENRLFEICWNNHSNSFVYETSHSEYLNQHNDFSLNVPFSSLSYAVKKYLFSRFLSGTSYKNFEEYYLNVVDSLPSICVFVPYKSNRLSKSIPMNTNITVNLSENGKRTVNVIGSSSGSSSAKSSAVYTLSGFTFHLNKKTLNSYVLCPPSGNFVTNPASYSVNGWKLFVGGSPIFYRNSLGGFTVSKKYYKKMLEMGAFDDN